MTTRVYGTITSPTLVPVQGTITFTLVPLGADSSRLVTSSSVEAVLDATGSFAINLWTNGDGLHPTEYLCILPTLEKFRFIIPSGVPSIDIVNCKLNVVEYDSNVKESLLDAVIDTIINRSGGTAFKLAESVQRLDPVYLQNGKLYRARKNTPVHALAAETGVLDTLISIVAHGIVKLESHGFSGNIYVGETGGLSQTGDVYLGTVVDKDTIALGYYRHNGLTSPTRIKYSGGVVSMQTFSAIVQGQLKTIGPISHLLADVTHEQYVQISPDGLVVQSVELLANHLLIGISCGTSFTQCPTLSFESTVAEIETRSTTFSTSAQLTLVHESINYEAWYADRSQPLHRKRRDVPHVTLTEETYMIQQTFFRTIVTACTSLTDAMSKILSLSEARFECLRYVVHKGTYYLPPSYKGTWVPLFSIAPSSVSEAKFALHSNICYVSVKATWAAFPEELELLDSSLPFQNRGPLTLVSEWDGTQLELSGIYEV